MDKPTSPEAAPAAPLLMQDENSGRDGRRYNEWHASRPDARLNAREAAHTAAAHVVPDFQTFDGPAATPAAPSAVTDERECFEQFWRDTMNIEVLGLWRTNFPMTKPEDQRYVCHDTGRAWEAWQARAALAQPAPVQQEAPETIQAKVDRVNLSLMRRFTRMWHADAVRLGYDGVASMLEALAAPTQAGAGDAKGGA